MNKEYVYKNKDINIVLKEIEGFKKFFEPYLKQKQNYSYTYNVYKENEIWIGKIKISNEQINFERTQKIKESSGAL